jgi:sulfate transport system ATP-binding protein
VLDEGVIEQVGTPEQVYMEPATPFVARFVGESNRLPAGTGELHVRPHDLEIVEEEGEPVLVDNVFRKGGVWRVEGTLGGAGGRVVEIDLDATEPPPPLGRTVLVRPRRAKTFTSTGAPKP